MRGLGISPQISSAWGAMHVEDWEKLFIFWFFFFLFTLSPLFLPSPRLVPQHPGRVSKELSLADRGGFSLLEGPGQQRTLSEVFSGTD